MDKQAVRRGDSFLEYAQGDEAFADWLRQVNRKVMARFLVGLFDLGDLCMRDAYDSGESAEDFFVSEVLPAVAEEFGDDILESDE